MGDLPAGVPQGYTSRFRIDQVVGAQIDVLRDWLGMPGFLMGAIKANIFGGGTDFFAGERQLATSDRITSTQRWLYETLNVGGAGGACFIAGTKVRTYEGYKAIEEVKVGDKVLSKGIYRNVVRKFERETDEALLRIKSIAGGVDFTCTPNHKIPILRRHRYKGGHVKPFSKKNYDILELHACEIQKGDFLFYDIDKTEEEEIIDLIGTGSAFTREYVYKRASQEWAETWEMLEKNPSLTRKDLRNNGIKDAIAKEVLYQYRHHKTCPRIFRYLPVDNELAYIIGWYIAEGNVDSGKICFSMHREEELYADRILNFFNGLGFNGRIDIEDNSLYLYIYSAQLARWFSIFGDTARNKRIPEFLKRLPVSKLTSLVEGLVLGDGWWGGFSTTSDQLARDFIDCLRKLGRYATCVLDYIEKPNGKYPQGTPRKETKRHYFQFRSGVASEWKYFEETYLAKVSSIEDIPGSLQKVYDLEVEDVHYYTVEGAIVHNSEFFRRFITGPRRGIEQVNPIPNAFAGGWLPGSLSIFPGDRDAYQDFTRGDPFTRVPVGEARLPGRGYEALHALHSGKAGQYSPVDRLLVLSDVAPYSDAYKHYSTIVNTWMKAGVLSDEWSRKVIDAKARVQERMASRNLGTPNLMAAPVTETLTGTVTRVTGPGTFRLAEYKGQTFRLAGIHSGRESVVHQMLADKNASTVEQARAKTEQLYSSLKQRMQALQGQQIQVQVARDEAARYKDRQVQAIVPGISEQFYETALGARKEPGLAAHLRAGPITRALGSTWYDIASTQPPFPFGWLKNKLIGVRTPVEDYYQFQVQTQRVGMWESPVQSYLKPWVRSWANWVTPGDNIPQEELDRRTVDQRFGAMKYLKARMNMAQAAARGDIERTKYFEKEAKGTPLGINVASPRDIMLHGYKSLPESERRYLETFKGLTDTGERARALNLVSPSMGYLLTNYWSSQIPSGQFTSPAMIEPSGMYPPDVFRGNVLADLLANVQLPGKDWQGWDGRVNLNAAKTKYIERIGEDIHNFGMWESDVRQYERQFPDLPVPDILDLPNNPSTIFQENMHRLGLTSQVLGYNFGYGGRNNQNFTYRVPAFHDQYNAYRSQDYRLVSSLYNYR